MTPVVAITGPTASGKSAVADALAARLGTEVISADAMQVYRGMDIGTAKTPVEDRTVPLRLVDIVDPAESYSAALYQRDARREIDRLRARGCIPVLCGGTGLYIRAALDDMRFPRGDVSDGRRRRYQELSVDLGAEGLHRMLAERDPQSAAAIHPHNVKRVIRALEMCDEGTSYAEQKAGFSQPKPFYAPVYQFALICDRAKLYERIDRRVDEMMNAGLVAEVRGLIARGARDALTSKQAIGYKEIMQALEGEYSMIDAVDLIKQRSRRYAKRQLSWCRRDHRMIWIDMDTFDCAGAVDFICEKAGV